MVGVEQNHFWEGFSYKNGFIGEIAIMGSFKWLIAEIKVLSDI